MSLNIRIVKKILYRGAAPLYCLEEKGWFGGWSPVTWGRYCKLVFGYSPYRNKNIPVAMSAKLELVERKAERMVEAYKQKWAAEIDRNLGFKETAEVVAEYSTDTFPSEWL